MLTTTKEDFKYINFDALISSGNCTIPTFDILTAQRGDKEKQWLYYFLMHKEAVLKY